MPLVIPANAGILTETRDKIPASARLASRAKRAGMTDDGTVS